LQDEPPPVFEGWSYRLRLLAAIGAAVTTAAWVFDTTAGAAQQLAWLMERARPACMHGRMSNEELHSVAVYELGWRQASTMPFVPSYRSAIPDLTALAPPTLSSGLVALRG
jgi:hypothetical protein